MLYNNEDAWQTILQKLRQDMATSLESEGEDDLVLRHEMIIMDDKAKYDGATSHDIRDHFTSWVFDNLPDIMVKTPTESALQLVLVNDPISVGPEVLAKHFGARDPEDRDYPIHPDYEDGETDMEEEDVGWMYLEVGAYVEMYDMLEEEEWSYELYRRPPLLPYDSLSDQTPGSWRKRKNNHQSPSSSLWLLIPWIKFHMKPSTIT
ncbi:hypothetical protein H103_06570 [Trichophyton rubrum CBS 288.86]|uniref:Uncharacterized protein n=2 Tax=Trichophyton rubrum TaxID=5551 RepID=F2SIT6_TRIRC|nr:uncharacterized protein TERG_01920 [Trichophyton rubrum CBS 118892]EZF12759.1 hypothetical protein H100_06578 [Trichophyton rubrum MR850]EZF39207.1 hypothetical protein H102_06545 [Trichophyton rubrum CBS 100081]EZF49854.1 hypothetical protein H103_06570 [Trichophyton rubrum CBS 288.86]EZG03752.1 hypothetical protein H106_06412 [Trichophyton rubrum CBS 735.88]EZG14176.1 hypothetical protein H107_06716 [Trichophyton rubrum CBS 202.88]